MLLMSSVRTKSTWCPFLLLSQGKITFFTILLSQLVGFNAVFINMSVVLIIKTMRNVHWCKSVSIVYKIVWIHLFETQNVVLFTIIEIWVNGTIVIRIFDIIIVIGIMGNRTGMIRLEYVVESSLFAKRIMWCW